MCFKEPLDCLACGNLLLEPVTLRCSHAYCRACVETCRCSESSSDSFHCSLCRCDSQAEDSFPRVTDLIRLLTADDHVADVCANCDLHSSLMFFCQTCQQLLCASCKSTTHQAKVFLSHAVVPWEERLSPTLTHPAPSTCQSHGQEVTQFSMHHGGLFACEQCCSQQQQQQQQQCQQLPTYTTLAEANGLVRSQLDDSSRNLQQYEADLKADIGLQQQRLEELAKMKQAELEPVEALFGQLMEHLKKAHKRALNAVERRYEVVLSEMTVDLDRMRRLVSSARLGHLLLQLVSSWPDGGNFLCYAMDFNGFVATTTRSRPAGCRPLPNGHASGVQEFVRVLEGLGIVLTQPKTIGCGDAAKWNGSYSQLSSSSLTSGYSSSFGSWCSTQSYGNATTATTSSNSSNGGGGGGGGGSDLLRRDIGTAFAEKFGGIHCELLDCRRHFSTIVQAALELQRDVTLRKCLTSSNRFCDIQQQGHKLKLVLGSHSSRVDELQPIFQRIWEEQLDRVKVQQEVYRNHVNTVSELRRDLQHLITASEQMKPFVDTIYEAIIQVDPTRAYLGTPGPMEQLCSQITTLEPNSQVRVSAIERQEHQRRADMEKKRLQSGNVLADAKRLLKSPPIEVVSKSKATNCPVVMTVGRDRLAVDQKPYACRRLLSKGIDQSSRRPDSDPVGMLAGGGADLESTFVGMLSCAKPPPPPPLSHGSRRTAASLVYRTTERSECTAAFEADNSEDVSALMQELLWSQTLLSLADNDRTANEPDKTKNDSSANAFSPLPFKGQQSTTNDAILHAKLPQNLISLVRPSTLEAREKMLASLKSKISRQGSP